MTSAWIHLCVQAIKNWSCNISCSCRFTTPQLKVNWAEITISPQADNRFLAKLSDLTVEASDIAEEKQHGS